MAPPRNPPRRTPESAEERHRRALALLAERRWDQAMEAFRQAFLLDRQGAIDRRPCMDWFRTLTFEEVPEFWRAEVLRFFKRADLDKTRYVGAALNVLMADPAFRAVVDAAQAPGAFAPERASLERVMADELFALLLRDCLVAQSRFETTLTRLRAALLLDESMAESAPLAFACNLALQCHNNEFAYFESEAERAKAADLAGRVNAALPGAAPAGNALQRSIALVGMYRPLHTVRGIEALLGHRHASGALERLLRRAVAEVLEERKLAAGIGALGEITDPDSLQVRAQYEANPYPRWLSYDQWPAGKVADFIAEEVSVPDLGEGFPADSRLLVAGCGTGIETISLATRMPEARITAIDLSRASLAYAMRMARQFGLRNVEFLQADLLALGAIERRFDLVYSTGVLHHLREPAQGVRVLAALLRPGGLLKVGLYSRRARARLSAARDLVKQRGLDTSAASIRAFRREVVQAPQDSPLRGLLRYTDFFTTSGCRDLAFNVLEHEFALPQAAGMLRDAGLEVLGVSQLPGGTAEAFDAMYPGGGMRADMQAWDAFEARHPDTFIAMFHLWARRLGPKK